MVLAERSTLTSEDPGLLPYHWPLLLNIYLMLTLNETTETNEKSSRMGHLKSNPEAAKAKFCFTQRRSFSTMLLNFFRRQNEFRIFRRMQSLGRSFVRRAEVFAKT